MPCSSVSRIAGSYRSRCRNVNFLPDLSAECCPDVCPMLGSRASLLRRRVLPFVLGGLCCLFASATRVRSGLDVRSLFCLQVNVRNAVLIAAQCPGLWLRPCAAVCCRSPYPLPASSPCVTFVSRGDFGDFGVSFASTVAGRYTRWGGPRLSVQGQPIIVLTRGP